MRFRTDIEFYTDVKEMPIKRYHEFNKQVMKDCEVGVSFEDYDQRTSKAIEYINKGLLDSAVQELDNRRIGVFNAYNSYDPKNRAIALMVKSINGKIQTDISDKGLERIIDLLDKKGYTRKEVEENVEDLKKKFNFNLKLISRIFLKKRNK